MKFQLIKTKITINEEVSCFKSLRSCIYHANNVKIPTIVGILTFMSRINFVLSLVGNRIFFYNLGAWLQILKTGFLTIWLISVSFFWTMITWASSCPLCSTSNVQFCMCNTRSLCMTSSCSALLPSVTSSWCWSSSAHSSNWEDTYKEKKIL